MLENGGKSYIRFAEPSLEVTAVRAAWTALNGLFRYHLDSDALSITNVEGAAANVEAPRGMNSSEFEATYAVVELTSKACAPLTCFLR